MKKIVTIVVLVLSAVISGCTNSCSNPLKNQKSPQMEIPEKVDLKILQLNIWKECTEAPDAVNSLINQVYYLDPDVATFCELYKNERETVLKPLVSALKEKGRDYYVERVQGRAIISKYPIVEKDFVNVWSFKTVLDVCGQRVAIYPSHSEYRYYTCYYPRGYDDGVSSWNELPEPITDVNRIIEVCDKSDRVEAARAFVENAKAEIAKGSLVFYAGDFNEPSHLDWTEETKNLFDHNGCVVPWPLSKYLIETEKFVDSYREKYPNPVTHPGFTFPSVCPNVAPENISWAPKADERDRIDMIYYYPNQKLSLKDICLAGPDKSIVRCKEEKENTQDVFLMDKNSGWPSDHKGVLATFEIKLK